jgi:D-lactate dehydrogenase
VAILIASSNEAELSFYRSTLPGHTVLGQETLSICDLEAPEEIEVLATDVPLGATQINRLPRLKLICARSTGVDHIDVPAAKRRSILVCNAPVAGISVAEHAFALLLSLARKTYASSTTPRQDLIGFELSGKTVGVIGAGRIGRRILRIADGFGMTCLAYDAYPNGAEGFRFVSLAELLRKSDVVILSCALTEETRGLFDHAAFRQMKEGAILVNVSRGAVVDTKALSLALLEGRLAGACLDVLEGESSPAEAQEVVCDCVSQAVETILQHPNVIVTPHRGYFTREALQRVREETAGNITAFMNGAPQNVV